MDFIAESAAQLKKEMEHNPVGIDRVITALAHLEQVVTALHVRIAELEKHATAAYTDPRG